MQKLIVPELPSDEEIVSSYPSGAPVSELLPAMWMRDQLAPHQLAAKKMFEALKDLRDNAALNCTTGRWCYQDALYCVPCGLKFKAEKALADVQKIY